MTTIQIDNTDIDSNVYEALVMQSEVMDDIMTYAAVKYGDDAVERIFTGDMVFIKLVSEEYWTSVLN